MYDFFFWGYLKGEVYQDNSQLTVEALEERIREEVVQIPLAMRRINNNEGPLRRMSTPKQTSSYWKYFYNLFIFT